MYISVATRPKLEGKSNVVCFFPQDGKMMFEQEVYNNFSMSLSKPYFITFAGDVSCPLLLHLSSNKQREKVRKPNLLIPSYNTYIWNLKTVVYCCTAK